MNSKIAVFDNVDTFNPDSHNYKLLGGNHYGYLVTNDSAETIKVLGIPCYSKAQFVDEKPPVMMDEGLNPCKSSINYDVDIVIPNSVALTDIYVTKFYFAGIQ